MYSISCVARKNDNFFRFTNATVAIWTCVLSGLEGRCTSHTLQASATETKKTPSVTVGGLLG